MTTGRHTWDPDDPEEVSSLAGFELIEQLCRDLNSAHDEILRLQDCSYESFDQYDWPEWSPQANSIRAAEKLLGKRLAKTNAWTLFQHQEVQSMSSGPCPMCRLEALAGESAPPRQFSATTESWLRENESAKYGLDPLLIPTHVVQELLGCARMARSPETTPAPPQDKWLENFTLDLNDAIDWAEQDRQGRALDVLYEMRDKIQARLKAASPETPRGSGETPQKERQ